MCDDSKKQLVYGITHPILYNWTLYIRGIQLFKSSFAIWTYTKFQTHFFIGNLSKLNDEKLNTILLVSSKYNIAKISKK